MSMLGREHGESLVGGCVAMRLKVAQLAPGKIVKDAGGLLCVGANVRRGLPGLVLIYDETDQFHESASATNAMEWLLPWLEKEWAPHLTLRECTIAERDSDGYWDIVFARWSAGACEVSFAPIKWPGKTPRSEEAMVWLLGQQGLRALAAADKLRRSGKWSCVF